jgi:hypothetical protein
VCVLSLACRSVLPLALATLILASCGESDEEDPQTIRGNGYTASVPADWTLERPPRTIAAANPNGPEAVSVGSFRLAKAFRPALWNDAVAELNDVAARLAERVAPSGRVDASRDATIAGRRARLYEIRYTREGEQMLDRVIFILVGTREFQLTCRIRVDEPEVGDDACARLLSSFRPR